MYLIKNRDIVLDGLVFITLGIGLLSLFTISDFYFRQQLLFASFGIIGYFLIPVLSLNWYKTLFPLFYLTIIFSLIYLILFGQSIRGAASWINLGFFNFQPSEFSKFAIIYVVAAVLSNNSKVSTKFIHLALLCLPVLFLTFIQPDLGTATVLVFIIAFMTFATIISPKQLLIFTLLGVLLFIPLYGMLQPYQKQRITSFLNPQFDPLDSGYNVLQSQIAIGSAGIWGKGFRKNTQVNLNFLPEPHTDFIFAGATEAYGLIYSIGLLIVLFSLIQWIFIKYANKFNNNFYISYAFGVMGVLFFQTFSNIGMNLGLLPVTGLTLPLISYGGSSLLIFLIMIGFLQLFNMD